MKELQEKKIGFNLKLRQKEQNNYKEPACSNNYKRKEDFKSKLKLKKQSFRLQYQSKKS
jgi:hypothetical protein